MLLNYIHVLYIFQAGFLLANALVLFWHFRNLVLVSDACNSHSMLFQKCLLLCIKTPNTNYQYTRYFPNITLDNNY